MQPRPADVLIAGQSQGCSRLPPGSEMVLPTAVRSFENQTEPRPTPHSPPSPSRCRRLNDDGPPERAEPGDFKRGQERGYRPAVRRRRVTRPAAACRAYIQTQGTSRMWRGRGLPRRSSRSLLPPLDPGVAPARGHSPLGRLRCAWAGDLPPRHARSLADEAEALIARTSQRAVAGERREGLPAAHDRVRELPSAGLQIWRKSS